MLLPFCRREGIEDSSELDAKALGRLQYDLLTNGAKSGKALSRATINSYLRSVRVFLNWAKRGGEVVNGKVRMLKGDHEEEQPLTRTEITPMENAAER